MTPVFCKNYQYSPSMRVRALMLHGVKRKLNTPETDKSLYNFFSQEMHTLRRELKNIAQEHPDHTIIYPYDKERDEYNPDECCVIYKKPFKFKGTKREFNEYLWQNQASRVCGDYDCTGKWFTLYFKIGYMGNDLWKVAEYMGLDV